MPIKLFDRVKQKTITAGSGTVTLGDSVDAFLDFSGVFTDGDQTFYTIESPTIFEVGIGTYNAGTVSRDTVLKSSNSDNYVDLPGDLNTYIFVTYPASGSVFSTGIGNTYIEDYGTITYIDAQDDAVSGYIVTVSGNLQTQITSNDNDIVILSGLITDNESDITALSGYVDTQDNAISGYVDTVSGNLQTQITNNDTDISNLQTATGNLDVRVTQNASDIATVSGDVVTASGYLQGQITSNDGDITALQTATGNLDTRVTQNASDIVTVSGDVVTASGYLQGQITSNDGDITALQIATGNLDTRVTQNASDIVTVSGIAQDAADDVVTASGYLQGQITSNDGDITALQTATGNLDTRVTQNTSDIVTVSGIAQDAADDIVIVSGLIINYSADSGVELIGSTFIMGGTGNLDKLIVTTPDSNQVPITIIGAAAQSENLQEWQDSSTNVVAYIDKDGNALFSGLTALGDLNVSGTLTYINSTNVTIADKQLELASNSGSPISGDAGVDEGGIVLKSTNGDKEWIWRDSTNAWTSNQNIDVGSNNVIFDGISQTIAYTGQEQVVSGVLQPQIDQNTTDISTVSGLLYNNWNINVTGNTDSITGNETLTVTGEDLISVYYNDASNLLSISGTEAKFTTDLTVSLSDGKTFGRYEDGETIPASGKTAREVIQLSIAEPISPTVSLTSPTTVAFNQTGISNTLNFSHTINSLGASVSSASLEYRRGGVGSWTTLSTSTTTPDSYVHSFTDTNFNTSGMNYRYIVTDTLGASNTGTLTITPASYSAPSISWNMVGNALSGIETNTKRERGNVDSQINGTVTRNSANVDLISYDIQYNVDGGGWTSVGSGAIGPGTDTIPSTGHNPTSDNTANQIQYRIQVIDEYQQYLSSQVTSSTKTINFLFYIFYGPVSSAPLTSNDVRAIVNKIFTDGSNPFELNTGSTLKDFTVAMPNTLSISQVLDLDALSANITASYVNNPFNVNDAGGTAVSYNVYTMSNAVPYASNHRHEVTRS